MKRTLGLCLVVWLPWGALASAEVATTRPYQAVQYTHEVRSDPPQEIYVAAIDLLDPNVRVRVARGGDDPDGEGKWQTTLMRPTKIAEREGFDVVINGDFFKHLGGKDAEGAAALKEFKGGVPAMVSGPAETDGKVWATTQKARAAIVVSADGKVGVAALAAPTGAASQVIAGSDVLVRDGKIVAPRPEKSAFSKGPHPRTAVGIADGGKTLLLVVIDGRKKGRAVGMSLMETAEVLAKYGASDAINLDGGGSSVLAIRNPATGKMEIMNHPSDGQERAVANVLGVSVRAKSGANNTR